MDSLTRIENSSLGKGLREIARDEGEWHFLIWKLANNITDFTALKIRDAAAALKKAFMWGSSSEGFSYWFDLHEQLKANEKQLELDFGEVSNG
jgi:hypothetical protein